MDHPPLHRPDLLYAQIVEQSDAVISVVDAHDRLVYANRAYERLVHTPSGELVGRTLRQRWSGEIAEMLAGNNARVRRERRAISFEEAVAVGGERRSYLSIKFPLYDAEGGVSAVCSISSDITDLRRVRDELERSALTLEAQVAEREGELAATRERLELAFEAARMGAWEWRRDGAEQRFFWSARLLEMHGLTRAPAGIEDFLAIIHPQDAERVRTVFSGIDASYAFLYRYRRPDGAWRTFEWRGAIAPGTGDAAVARGVVLDVTEEHELRAEIDRLAYSDAITGLPNRRLLEDRVEQAIRQARGDGGTLALLLLDLDEFKLVNEALGHAAGDELLQALAERLSGNLSERDTVARLGGDEFAILLSRLDEPHDALRTAERLHTVLASPFRIAGRELLVSASIGISIFPDDATGLTDLMRHADAAMYRAKGPSGIRTAVHSDSRPATNLARLTLRSAMRRGIEEGQFTLVYQPRVELAERAVTGVEALARWRSPDLGDVPPAEFIPAAERSGLIVPLGRELLRRAARRWRAHVDAGGGPLVVAVNVSPRQLVMPDFPTEVERILAEAGMPPEQLELELTESVVLDAVQTGGGTIRALDRLGVALSIDDFGTGLSSLRYLARLPVDALKIDRSFVAGLDPDRREGRGNAIPAAVVAMAASFGLEVIAEGVETEAQERMLVELGCTRAQGFGLRRPAPWDEAVAPLR